jgi:hypothetical protein
MRGLLEKLEDADHALPLDDASGRREKYRSSQRDVRQRIVDVCGIELLIKHDRRAPFCTRSGIRDSGFFMNTREFLSVPTPREELIFDVLMNKNVLLYSENPRTQEERQPPTTSETVFREIFFDALREDLFLEPATFSRVYSVFSEIKMGLKSIFDNGRSLDTLIDIRKISDQLPDWSACYATCIRMFDKIAHVLMSKMDNVSEGDYS